MTSFQAATREWEDPEIALNEYRRLDDILDSSNISYITLTGDQIPRRGPLLEAKVQRAAGAGLADQTRLTGHKPLWVHALMFKSHLNRGEPTSVCPDLAKIIRNRGITTPKENSDDCGHVVANSVGGNMVDINLFPQNMNLNRGWKGNYILWRCIEACMLAWLTFVPERYRPRVEFQMLLGYNDASTPDRPNHFIYAVKFLLDGDDSDDEKDDDEHEKKEWVLCKNIINVAAVAMQDLDDSLQSALTEIKGIISAYNVRRNRADREDDDIYCLYRHLKVILDIIKKQPKIVQTPTPCLVKLDRDRGLSVWDFVPVVGSIKSLKEGVEDFEDGNIASGVINVAAGGIGLALDFCTLGTISSLSRTVGKMALQEGGKQVAKKTGTIIAKVAVAEMAEVATTTAVSAVVKATARKVGEETRHE